MKTMANIYDEKIRNKRRMVDRRVTLYSDENQNSYIDNITKGFNCLKISILNKAARVSGEFDKVTLGPDADIKENGNILNSFDQGKLKTIKSPLGGTTSSRTNITFSIKKILLENEVQRREKVKKAVERKKLEMEKSQKKIQNELCELLSRISIQREKETAEKLAHLEAEEEQLAQQQEIDRKNEIQRQRLKESEEISKIIVPFQESFHAKWKDIANISKSCRDQKSASSLLTPYSTKLKELSMQMESINEKTRTGDLTSADIKLASTIVQCSDEILLLFKADTDKIDALYEEEIARREIEVKQQLEEIQAQEEAQRIKQKQDIQNSLNVPKQADHIEQEVRDENQSLDTQSQKVLEVDNTNSGFPQPQYQNDTTPVTPVDTNEVPPEIEPESTNEYPDLESLQLYIDSHQFLENYTSTYADFVKSDAMKKFKFECQKTLNITVNAISRLNRQQLIEKYDKLRLFLSGKAIPNILLNAQAEAYSKSLLAQKIVDQGDITFSSKPELAFPFAAITVALWNDWPDFGDLVLARFRCRSSFFVPVFFIHGNDQSEMDYYKSLGIKYNEDGNPEKPEQFSKRLKGLMYLYASICVTKQRQGINKSHPHGIANAWRWLAATINIEPRCDIADVCATLIYTMLEVTGNELWKIYPNQFPKMLYILYNVYYEKLKNFNSVVSFPISRLGDFLIKALEEKSIPPPKGQLPFNFW